MTDSSSRNAAIDRRKSRQAQPNPASSSGKNVRPSEGLVGKYTLDDQPGFLLRVVLRRHTANFTHMMVDGLTPPQFSTLAKLYEVGTCSQNYLGRLISYDSATITGVVERLRFRKLIVSRDDPADKRRSALELTPRGRRVAEAAIEQVAEISRKTFAPLTRSEKATLARLLRKLAEADD